MTEGINCPACGREIENPVDYTNKCENCYYKEAKTFVWVIGAIVFLLLVIGIVRYLIKG